MKRQAIKRSMLGNLSLKIIALAAGIILWAYVSSETMMQGMIRVQVDMRNLPAKMVVTKGVPPWINIMMSGPRLGFLLVSMRQVHYQMDMSGMEPGSQFHEIVPEELELPWNLKVSSIEPSMMKFEVDRLVKKEVPVRPDLAGMVKDGYFIREALASPASVTLSIPASMAKAVTSVLTEQVDVSGENSRVEKNTKLMLEKTGFVSASADRAVVEVLIDVRTVRKMIENIVPEVLNAPPGTKIIPARVALEIEGAEKVIERMPLSGISVAVDAAGLARGTHSIKPEVKLPEEVVLINCLPGTLKAVVP